MHTLDILRALRAGTIGIDEARRKLASATAPAPSPGTRARGVVVSSVQAPEAVALSEWRVAPPAAGEVTVHVRASAINFADVLCLNGLYPTMPRYPFVPGFEVAGVVAAVGAEVSGLAIGDAVIALTGERLGGHASHVNVPAANAIGKPDGLSFEDACGLPVVFSTVYYAFELAKLSSTEHVLVQSAAGGCGLMALQLAHERQAVAYGTSSRPEKLDLLRSIGVRHVIDYKAADIAHEIRRLTSNRGVDVVLNMLGGAAVQQGLDSLAPFGRYLEIAVHALKTGQKLDLSRLVQNQTFHSIDLRRAGLGGRLGQRALLDAMVSMLRSRRIVPIVSRVYPLHQIGDAFQHVSSGNHVGKVVVSHTAGAAIDRTADCVAALAAHKRRCDEAGTSQRSLVPVGAGVRDEAGTSRRSLVQAGAGGRDDAPRHDGIAIVSMAGRFPRANDVEELWENIAQSRDCISEVPPERWPADRFYDPKRQTAGKSYSRWMGVVQDAEAFDPLFFNISPAEAAWMDPQQRMFLEECWHCLEDGAIRPSALSGARCGVFVGCGPSDYGRDPERNGLHVHGLTGGASSILAARISYFLNLTGPCLAIETACSSSLVAIAQACDSLVAGNCDLALAGGVHLMFGPGLHVMTSDAGMLSEHGRCFTFDARANGFVPGEGVGVLLLKRLPDAKRAGDPIAGIIRGWGVNHDGRTNGITAPSVKSQAALEKEVYRRFAIDPGTITLVEAHGTGTALGDPIEIEALAEAFRAFTARTAYCAVGSIKSNIGHLMTAAGVAGAMKVLLSLRHRMLPPTINFERPNPHLPLEGSTFYDNTRLEPWVADPEAPRRAAVSSFGFSGTNAHLVIEEAAIEEAAIQKAAPAEEPCRDADRQAPGRHTRLFPLSAKSRAQVKRSASNLHAALANLAGVDLRDIAYTLQVGREPMEHRLVVLADSRAALEQLLDAYVHDRSSTALLTGHVQDARDAAAVEAIAPDGALSGVTVDEAEWRRIATSWLEGAFIDWDRLYAGEKPRRVRLPGYPFAHKRYAPPAAADRIGADAAGREPLAPLHPLVHRNTSDLDFALVAPDTPKPGVAARAGDGISLFRPRWIAADAPTERSASVPAIRRHLIVCEVDAIDRAAIQERLGPADCTMLHATGLELPEKYEQFSLQVLDVLQRIQRARPDRSVLVQLVGGGRSELLLHGLGGMLRAAQLESAVVCGQVIDAGEHRSPADLLTILEAEARERQFKEVRYRNGTRSVSGWEPIESSVATIPWRAGGVYVISGGGGRLGVLMAEEIARRAQGATIVLLGRRDPALAHAEVRGRLESLGASVRYHRIDVADRAAVERVIHDTASGLGAIHGIVHAAGVLRDGYIYKKLPDDVRAVLAPKVGGIVNLDLASRSLPLDVFIAFSSFAGAMANAGQADYVAANAFMDAYARHRASLVEAGERHGRTLSVNWPLWRDGGMRVDAATERRMARDLGLVPLDTGAALDAMYRGLATGDPQVLVLSGDPETIGRRLFGRGAEPERHATTGTPAAVANAGQAPDGATRMRVERVLVQAVSGLLGIDAHEIDRDTELGELGCDSIAFAKLAGRLAEQYGIELAPIVFFEHRTINALATFLLHEHGPALIADLGGIQNPEPRTQNPEPNPEHEPGTRNPEPGTRVAVIGMSGCFPKAPDLRAFWENLVAGRDCIDEIPASRWDWRDYHGGPGEEGNVTWTRHGAFIDGVDEFDALFFGISPAEAELMDPQQRLLMTHVWWAIEDAGYAPHSLAGSNSAIFVGTGSTGYSSLLDRANAAIKGYSSTGSVPSIGPNRMSFLLDWHGPSEPIETACSSSLVAVHRALQAIEQGACDAAVVGGVNTIVTPDAHIGFAKAGMLSASGRCKTFSDQADGYVRGEGVGMLFLKRLSLAERDGDHIYALLLASAENHGGRANSLTAPNPGAQAALLEAAYDKAGIDPRTVGYIEAHGTGTPLGDPIEIDALKRAFSAPGKTTDGERVAAAQCGVGSVKTNIGHLELAAGIAGLIKVVLQLRHQTLVESLHCDRLNPHIVLDDSPFFIVGRTMPWQPVRDADGTALPRRAGVSSFGFGGVNAHVVVEEYVDTRPSGSSPSGAPSVIVLSARTERQLQQQAEQLLEALDREGYSDSDLADIAFTLQTGRDAMDERLGFVVRSLDELKATLARWLGGAGGIEGLYRGRANRGNDALSAFAVDEDLHGAIDAWFRKRKYDALLDLWTKGMEIDWRRVHADAPRRRLSLPTYPFARDRYWVPQGRDERGSVGTRGQPGEARYLHPLLHTNTSTLAEQQYTTAFTGDEPFLTDHRVRGHRILPGVAHLEIARAAFQMASGLEPGAPVGIRLLDVIWRRPLLVGARGLQVIVALDGEPDGRVGFRVYSRSQGPKTVEHLYSQGRAEWLTGAPPHVDLAALRERCGEQALTAAQCYAAFTEAGIAYGAAHQGLASVRCGAGEVLGEVVLPSSMTARRAPYVLHPSLMDSALQAIIGLRASSSNAALAIPSGLAVLEVFASCPDRLWSWVRPAEVAAAGDGIETYDVDLIGDDGLVCVRLRSLALRTLGASVPASLPAAPAAASAVARPAARVPVSGAESLASTVARILRREISNTLKVDERDIDEDTKLEEYGFDSITLTELANRLNHTYHLEVAPTVLFEYPTIAALAPHLAVEYARELSA
ncbi:MAG: SDR family NAD(P)-dependent oxidoreductase, partial [Vicinamibacterales bacterium]